MELNIDSKVILIDKEDWVIFPKNSEFSFDKDGYLLAKIYVTEARTNILIRVHRWILGNPKGKIVDHINGNKYDLRKSNLRIATASQNCANKRKTTKRKCTSTYKGVYKNKTSIRWHSAIKFPKTNKTVYLGSFSTELEAAVAYNTKARELYGEYARINEI